MKSNKLLSLILLPLILLLCSCEVTPTPAYWVPERTIYYPDGSVQIIPGHFETQRVMFPFRFAINARIR